MTLDTIEMDGEVIIGEGEKDQAPMLYNHEQLGSGSVPALDIAVDPFVPPFGKKLYQTARYPVMALDRKGRSAFKRNSMERLFVPEMKIVGEECIESRLHHLLPGDIIRHLNTVTFR